MYLHEWQSRLSEEATAFRVVCRRERMSCIPRLKCARKRSFGLNPRYDA